MPASIIDGKSVATQLRDQIKQTVTLQTQNGHPAPGLAVVLIGQDPASTIYVKNKRTACVNVGFQTYDYSLPEHTSEEELLKLIDFLNQANDIHGILVQLPLPPHINTHHIIERITPHKDVDGFHPYNLGLLAQGRPHLRPCTPYGIIKLLDYYNISLAGKHAVVVGASNIVGRPMALEFLAAKATVTICHRQTRLLEQHVRHADIIVIATGSFNVVKPQWLQPNQIIIDVGMHRREDGTLHGDIDFEKARQQVAWITPVPGGVGPMTIATLLENTLLAYQDRLTQGLTE